MFRKIPLKHWLLACTNSLICIFLTFFLLNTVFVHWDESQIVRPFNIIRNNLLNLQSPPPSNILFVDVSADLKLIDKTDEFGFPRGNQAITDRKKIAGLFQTLSKNPQHQWLICDVFFVTPSPDDSILQQSVKKLPRLFVANHLNAAGMPTKLAIDAPYAICDVYSMDGTIFRYRYIHHDTVKTLPVVLAEQWNHKSFSNGNYFLKDSAHSYLNLFTLDFRITNDDLYGDSIRYPVVNLGELLQLGDTSVWEMTKDKLVVLGDFAQRDVHESVHGSIGGSLILVNAYLSLIAGDNIIYWHFYTLLFVIYLIISMSIIRGDLIKKWVISKLGHWKLTEVLTELLGNFAYLALFSLLAYLIYGIHLPVFLMGIFITLEEWIWEYLQERKLKKENTNTVQPD